MITETAECYDWSNLWRRCCDWTKLQGFKAYIYFSFIVSQCLTGSEPPKLSTTATVEELKQEENPALIGGTYW